jgi:hypothetical protein
VRDAEVRASLRDASPKIFERLYKRKSQNLSSQEQIKINEGKITFRSVPILCTNPLRMQEEEPDEEDEPSWQSASSFLFDSFSANEVIRK